MNVRYVCVCLLVVHKEKKSAARFRLNEEFRAQRYGSANVFVYLHAGQEIVTLRGVLVTKYIFLMLFNIFKYLRYKHLYSKIIVIENTFTQTYAADRIKLFG